MLEILVTQMIAPSYFRLGFLTCEMWITPMHASSVGLSVIMAWWERCECFLRTARPVKSHLGDAQRKEALVRRGKVFTKQCVFRLGRENAYWQQEDLRTRNRMSEDLLNSL